MSHSLWFIVLTVMHLLRDSNRFDGLTERARRGDLQAFRDLYRLLYPIVNRYVSRRLRERTEVEDVIAYAFERLIERMPGIDPEKGGALAFVCGTARNRMIDLLRTRKAVVCLDEAINELVESRTPLSELLAHEEYAVVSECVASFPAPLREMFALRYADGLSCAAIAQMMGLPESAVRKRFSRALRELRLRLSSHPLNGREREVGGYT